MGEQQIPNQIAKLTGALAEHQENFAQMSVEDRQWVIQNTVSAIALFAEAVANRTQKEPLLELVGTVKMPAVKKFVARKKFCAGETTDGVPIAWLGDNFKNNFLGKTEENVPAAELKNQRLRKGSLDKPILAELGGEKAAKIFLANFWEILREKTRNGETGWMFGYILADEDDDDTLWAVDAARFSAGDGWAVRAYSVESPLEWSAGVEVVSR